MDDHESSVVVGDITDTRHSRAWRRVVKPAAVILAVVIIAGGLMAWRGWDGSKDSGSSDEKTPASSLSKTQSLVLSDDYDSALQAFNDELLKARSSQDRADTYHNMALLSVNNDKLVQALTYARKANDAKPSAAAWGVMGIAFEKQGKWQEAADAYGKAAGLSEKTGNDTRSDYAYYTSKQGEAEAHL